MAMRLRKSTTSVDEKERTTPTSYGHASAIGDYKWPVKAKEKTLMLLSVGLDDKIISSSNSLPR